MALSILAHIGSTMMVYMYNYAQVSRYASTPSISKFRKAKGWIGGFLYVQDGIYDQNHKLAIL